MLRKTRPISWEKAADKAFRKFPREVQERGLRALNLAAEGQKADIAKTPRPDVDVIRERLRQLKEMLR